MAFVRVEQRNAHLAGAVRLQSVAGRDGPVSRAVLTAISNTRKGTGDNRGEEATVIQWTLWGKQADNAAQYLGKGSHVNVAGRVQNNNYERDGQVVYAMVFTAEEIDYLDSRAEGEAIRARSEGEEQGQGQEQGQPAAAPQSPQDARPARRRNRPAPVAAADDDNDVPF